MNTFLKASVLLCVAFIVTLVTALVAALMVMLIAQPRGCSAYGQTMLTMWAVIGGVFLVSMVGVGVASRRAIPSLGGRVAFIAVYVGLLLLSFGLIALMTMVIFNC